MEMGERGVSLLVPRARKKRRRRRFEPRAKHTESEVRGVRGPRGHEDPHNPTHTTLSLSLAHFTLLVDEAHTNEQTRRRTCMPAMATGLRVALEATLRDWVGLATRAFLEDMIMEFMVSKLV